MRHNKKAAIATSLAFGWRRSLWLKIPRIGNNEKPSDDPDLLVSTNLVDNLNPPHKLVNFQDAPTAM
jgi:hypothetical protein